MFSNIFRKICASVVATVMVGSVAVLQSCSKNDKEEPEAPKQGLEIRFVYDSSAETAKPDCLTLFVYNETNGYVKTVTETSSALNGENYTMPVDLPEGKYQLIAWGGVTCSSADFSVVTTPAAGSTISGLQVEMKDNCKNANPGVNLHPLFYGGLTVEVPAESDKYTSATISMMNDVNNIRVNLQNENKKAISVDDFIFEIVDDNTLLNYQNGIIPQTPVTYNPYATGQSVSNDIPVAYADFSTSRLIVGGNCVLSVKKKVNSQVVLSIPVVDYLLYGKGENSSMTDQNYIDQQNQWSITLYIQESFWVNTHVKINDWEFRLNDAKL